MEALKKVNWVSGFVKQGAVHAKVCHLADKYCELMQNSPAAIREHLLTQSSKGSQKPWAGFSTHILWLNQWVAMDNAASDLPTLEELQESIDGRAAYAARTFERCRWNLGKKLRLSRGRLTPLLQTPRASKTRRSDVTAGCAEKCTPELLSMRNCNAWKRCWSNCSSSKAQTNGER